jgi:hypothetical protein
MGYVLDLAVELPVYQRKQLYAYNANIIDASSFPEDINPYSSPLDRIWEIKFTDNAAAGGSAVDSNIVAIIGGAVVGVAVVAVVVKFLAMPKKKRRALLGIKKVAYNIPVEDIDEEDLNDYYLLNK